MLNQLSLFSIQKFGFQIVWQSNGRYMYYVLDQHSEYWTITYENKMASICPVFKRLGFTELKWHQNNRPFGIRPLFDHSNTKLVWYTDPNCKDRVLLVLRQAKKINKQRANFELSQNFFLIWHHFMAFIHHFTFLHVVQ